MLRHLASHHDPQDFPSTAYERQALLEAAGKRRLIEWQKDNRRYELTPIGWRRLRRGRGFVPLAIGAGLGAAIGAGALAMLWLPGDRPANEQAAVRPQAEKMGALAPAPPPAAPSPIVPAALVRDAAPSAAPERPAQPAKTADRPAEPARTADPAAAPAKMADAPAGPARVAERPGEAAAVAEQPASPEGEAAATAAKEPARRSRHRSARTYRRWHFGRGHYRDERYAGPGRLFR